MPDPDARCSTRSGCRLPLFIKWDDSEYGLRAKAAGYPTVTFPGAAVWHVPWTDKNDALDWQAYFHQRNRFVAALLHSPYPHGGRMVRESLNHQIKHLVSMQYSTVELRHQALEDVLAGPDALHDELPTKLPEVKRARASSSPTRQLEADPDAFPPVTPQEAAAQGQGRHRGARPARAADHRRRCAPIRQLRPAARAGAGVPRGRDPRAWTPSGTASRRYDSRDRLDARRHLGGALPARPASSSATCSSAPSRSTSGCAASGRGWPSEYRAALPEITSPEAWEETFGPWLDGHRR